MRILRSRLLVVGTVAAASVTLGGPAIAAPPTIKDHYEFTVSQPFTECPGVNLWHDAHCRGFSSAQPRGRDDLVYFADRFRGTDVYTNLDTGKTYTIEVVGQFKDLHMTDNGDGTLTIQAMFSGHQFVYGPDGGRLFKDTGTRRVEFVVDHAGTPGDPDDDVFIHQGGQADTAGRDFCADVVVFTG